MFVFGNPCARANLHQQKRALKLCSATLNQLELALKNTTFKSRTPVSMYQFDPFLIVYEK